MIPYIIFIRIPVFLNPERYFYDYQGAEPFLNNIYSLISYPWLQNILCILLLFIQAILINIIINQNRISRNFTLFAGIIYILLIHLSPSLCTLSPLIIGITFFLIGLQQLFSTYKINKASLFIFNTGFFFAIATLFYKPFIVLLILGYVGLTILRSFRFRERAQYIAGYITPIYLYAGISYFLLGEGHSVGLEAIDAIGIIQFSVMDLSAIITISIIGILILYVFLSYNAYRIKKAIDVQKKIDLVYWVMLISVFITLISDDVSLRELAIPAIAIAILFSMSFSRIQNKVLTELIHLVFIMVICTTHFFL